MPRRARSVAALALICTFALFSPGLSGARGGRPLRHPAVAPDAPAPTRLADTGLYADFAARRVAADVLPYTPQYPLWSDGATKRRWVRLPRGAAIDASDPDAWVFPVGTKLWKEFSFGRRVETRLLERLADGTWRFAAYVWSADGSDARLAPERGIRGAAESRPGLPHDIPSVYDCRACHEGGPTPVLGFSALQLSPDRDPLAPNAERPGEGDVDLARLVALGLIRGMPAALVARPPRIAAPTPRARAALGYLHANCGNCHDARGPLASLGLTLVQPISRAGAPSPAVATAVGVASRFRPHDPGEGAGAPVRIRPGRPEASVLYRRMASRDPLAQMPPLGSHAVDEEALAVVAAWIAELPAD
ncbi:MAG TPA: hypothetical protein VLC54_15395 [Anaeromyxobacter sp.]|nr:hypothetical protein [Anaeromyxobacter sp.]